jgi:eukaryotic-like serine/threonine-protein kinase
MDQSVPIRRLNEVLEGRYRIEREVGEGGMARVYLAHDVRHKRRVALKVLKPEFTAVVGAARFLAEIETTANLQHPHILPLFDSGEADGFLFYVMPYVEGETLQKRIDRDKQLPVEEAVGIARAVADALQTAHEAGVVHRDIKPGNILLSRGEPLVADFGIALVVGNVSEARLTETGLSVGTPLYMSPEQATGGQTVGPSSDVFSLACVLYEMLVGEPPYTGRTSQAILAKLLQGAPVSAAADRKSLPHNVDAAIRKALERLPADRFREARDFAKALADPSFRYGEEIGVSAVTHRRWRLGAGVFAVTTVALALLSVWALTAGRGPPGPTQVAAPSITRFSIPFVPFDQRGAWDHPTIAVAADGSVAYVGQAADGRRQLYLRRPDRLEGVALPGTEGAAAPFFAPDGRTVAFFADGQLKKVTLDSGIVQSLCNAGPYGGAWVDHQTIVFSGPPFANGLMRVAASGGLPEALTELHRGEASHRWPTMSPSGRVVVFTTTNTSGLGLEGPRLVAQSLDTGTRELLPGEATYAVFAPDGRHLLLVQNGRVTTALFDETTLAIIGSPVPLLEGVIQSSSGAAQLSGSATVLAYLPGEPDARQLVWVDREGRVEPIDAPPRLYVHPRLSPDQQRIAVLITEPRNDLWIYDIPRGTLSPLTSEGGSAYPIWTRDGSRIAYVSGREGEPPNVFWKLADRPGSEERLLTSDNPQVTETFAPDGTLLFVERRTTTGWDILTLSPDGTRQPRPFLATPFNDMTPQISPSGRFVAYLSNETGQVQVVVRSFPEADVKLQVSAEGGGAAAWRGDERELYYRHGSAMMVAEVETEPTLRISRPRELFRGQSAEIQGKNWDVTPDGQRFLMVRSEVRTPPTEIVVVLNWREGVRPLPRPE